jgi:two-component system response regulator RpaA
MDRIFTTGQAAKICRVAVRTLAKWCDNGHLIAYRLEGAGHRRIPEDQLRRFMRDHGMPLGELAEVQEQRKVLVIGANTQLVIKLDELLKVFRYASVHSVFEAGLLVGSMRPDTIVIDLAIGRSEAGQIAALLQQDPSHELPLVIALANEDERDTDHLLRCGFSDVFVKPFDPALLAERILDAKVGVKTPR